VGSVMIRRGDVLLPPRAQNLEDWCAALGREDLMGEWGDPGKGPDAVTRWSKQKVWWKCGKEECGHRWGATAQVGNRARGNGCPACAGKVPTATNNFEVYCEETGRQELLGEWADHGRRPKGFLRATRRGACWHVAAPIVWLQR
jgi:hypothetical protein